MQNLVSISLNTLEGNFIHQSPWLFKYFQKNCWKLISMPFIFYTIAQYGGNSHRYHICIFMQTFTWINEVFCMSGFPFRHRSLFLRAHFQAHAENRALKQCLAAAAFPQHSSELAILNSFFLSISRAVRDPLSILNPYERAMFTLGNTTAYSKFTPCKWSSLAPHFGICSVISREGTVRQTYKSIHAHASCTFLAHWKSKQF